jgi:hypothetical protein
VLERNLKRSQVDLSQSPLGDDGVESHTLIFLVVTCEVFEARNIPLS